MTKYKIVNLKGKVLVTNIYSKARAERNAEDIARKFGMSVEVKPYEGDARARARVIRR